MNFNRKWFTDRNLHSLDFNKTKFTYTLQKCVKSVLIFFYHNQQYVKVLFHCISISIVCYHWKIFMCFVIDDTISQLIMLQVKFLINWASAGWNNETVTVLRGWEELRLVKRPRKKVRVRGLSVNSHGEWKYICYPEGRLPAGDPGCGTITSEKKVWRKLEVGGRGQCKKEDRN